MQNSSQIEINNLSWGLIMIRRIQFSNSCSFLEETEVDFTASLKTTTDDSFVQTEYGDQVSLLTGVFGPNAAGKTNLLKALCFTSFYIAQSYGQLKPDELIPLDRFAGGTGEGEPTRIEVEFSGVTGRFQYSVVLTQRRVHEEVLKAYSYKTGKFRTVLSRKTGEDGRLQLRSPEGFTETSLLREMLTDRPNASMLAAGLRTGRGEFADVLDAFGLLATNVNRAGKREQPFESLTSDLFACSEFFQKHPEYQDALRELLLAADVGITDFTFKQVHLREKDGESRESYLIYFMHEGPHGSFELPGDIESSGTRRLFLLFQTFIQILNEGGIAVIDEMESDLHPHLIPTIFSLFKDSEINRNQAQLFFTCHHVEMLNHLLKEQIILVEKRDDCVSEAFRLDEVKGVRREANFFANYNSGRYGAVPEPELVAF